MAYQKHGSKMFHVIHCGQKLHVYITDGMLFDLDEVKCKKHGFWAAVVRRNLRQIDVESYLK
jgi:hypothetical protein